MGFFGGGASVDLASPSAIGSTTPNTGAFTTLSANNGTITTSSPALTLAQTWNAAGTTFTSLRVNVTDTASNASSLLMDLQVGGASVFKIIKGSENSGDPLQGSGIFVSANRNSFIVSTPTSNADCFIYTRNGGGNFAFGMPNTSGQLRLNGATVLTAQLNGNITIANSLTLGGTDLVFARDAANIFAQRNSTNAQTFRLYNTFTDASNYERGFFRWNTNVLEIGAEAAGTGTQRQLRFPLGTVTASTPLSITQTWNAGAVAFTAIQANITDTSSASGSYLLDLQVGGSTKFRIGKGNTHYLGGNFVIGGGTAFECYASEATALSRTVSSRVIFFGQESSVGMAMSSGYGISWSSNAAGSGDCFSNRDLFLLRDAAGTLAQRNAANAQTFRLYRTFTDASNYERLGFLTTNTTRYTITSENAGTGSARSLEVSFYTAASDPTSTDITSGCFSVWKNSGTGTIKLWANDGGTMKSVALA